MSSDDSDDDQLDRVESGGIQDEDELKPGQKFPTPTPGFGDRVFYETLLRQRPDSAMAQEWCVAYGVLPYEQAEHMYTLIQERKRKLRMGGVVADNTSSPVRPNGTKSSSTASNVAAKTKKKKAKLLREDGMDIVGSGGDGIGRTTL